MLAGRALPVLLGGRQAAVHTGRILAAHGLAGSTAQSRFVRAMAAQTDTVNSPTEQQTPRVFADFSIYKSKGALTIKPVKPKWSPLETGWVVDRQGALMFELAAALGERRYNWEDKIQISLSPLELAALVSQPDQEHTFYHDTFKGQQGREGTKVKTFKWSPAPDGRAYFVNASMTDKTQGTEKKVSASVSLTVPELFCLKQLVASSIPAMFGFDVAFQNLDTPLM